MFIDIDHIKHGNMLGRVFFVVVFGCCNFLFLISDTKIIISFSIVVLRMANKDVVYHGTILS